MSDFRFHRLEKYKIAGLKDKIELRVPLPKSPTGKVYRWCPNNECTPRLFLLGDELRTENTDYSQCKRGRGTPGTTCPYCGRDGNDDEFNYDGDIESIKKYFEWALHRDIDDYFEKMAKSFNRSQPRGGLISMRLDFKSDKKPEPRAWREDLIRNLSCDICGREYGVYAIALFCPDCGCKNSHVHFEREIELILQQLDLAEQITEVGNKELSYRILGNAHEDVLTAFETYQKVFYKYMIREKFTDVEAKKMMSKQSIGNRFQNIDKATDLYKNLSMNPFKVLDQTDLDLLKINIEKRHVIGHNLSMADETYSDSENREKPGTTIKILSNEISDFAKIAQKIVLELERLM